MTPIQIKRIYQSNGSLNSVSTEDLVAAVAHFEFIRDDIINAPTEYFVQDQITNNNILELITKLIQDRAANPDISWKNTFNTSFVRYGYLDDAHKKVLQLGYPYFTWNGRVYNTETTEDTGILCENLK